MTTSPTLNSNGYQRIKGDNKFLQ